MSSSNNPDGPLDASNGAKFTPLYIHREVIVFGIHEAELKTLAYFNTAITTCFSIGSFFLAQFVEHEIEWKKDSAFFAMIAFYLAGCIAFAFRRGILSGIKKKKPQ